ncbi:MAG: GNAT family N-acetyltransferase [Rhodopirellula sp.]|nr:GNAT family N-acetyltransferase [Rhodopirellula sp.]
MSFPYDRSKVRSLPRKITSKTDQVVRLHLLDPHEGGQLAAMYLAYQPRNSFQGLPPIRDEVCIRWVDEMLASGVHIVARSTGPEIVGHCALFPINEQKCEILVVVDPGHQNLGIGTELTRSVIHLGCELGFEKIWLPVMATNLRARHVYKKCGFEYVPTKPSKELDMICDLSNLRTEPALPQHEATPASTPIPHFVTVNEAAGDWSIFQPVDLFGDKDVV